LAEESFVDSNITIYLNRLSDYLFVLGRKLNADEGTVENIWKPRM
jgi:cob(I)alamin adenosyltransferase